MDVAGNELGLKKKKNGLFLNFSFQGSFLTDNQ